MIGLFFSIALVSLVQGQLLPTVTPAYNTYQQQQAGGFSQQQQPPYTNPPQPFGQYGASGGSNQQGALQQTIYAFLSSNSLTTKFVSSLNQVAQQTNDQILIPALSGQNVPGMINPNQGYTVFVPVDAGFNQLAPTDPAVLKNDLSNFISKEVITLDQIDGKIISNTFGFQPRLMLKAVKNVYSWYSPSPQTAKARKVEKTKRQAYNPQQQQQQSIHPQQQQQQSQSNPFLQSNSPLLQQTPFALSQSPQGQQGQSPQSLLHQTGVTDPALLSLMQAQSNNGLSVYDTFNQIYGGQIPRDLYIDLNISPKLPLDMVR
jgi:hypothetical protein